MLKPMLKQQVTQSSNIIGVANQQEKMQQAQQLNKIQLDRLFRRSRSKQYVEAFHRLDAGGHTHNQERVNEIINTIRNEFPEVEINGVLLGYVSICYLGKPYEVHTLNMTGKIIEHYKSGQPLPGKLEKARSIAIRGGYEFIEVYVDCFRAISSNGTVSVIPIT